MADRPRQIFIHACGKKVSAAVAVMALAMAVFAIQSAAQGSGIAHYERGLIYFKARQYGPAIVHLTAAVQTADLKPNDLSDAYFYRARALIRAKRPEKAAKDLDDALTYWPENTKALRVRCRARALKELWAAAIKDCDLAVQLMPKDWRGWFTRGMVRRDNGDDDKAKGDFAAALMRMPENLKTFPAVYQPLRRYGLLDQAPEDDQSGDIEDLTEGD